MSKKIIVKISEGLGNQLFMYANAFAISKKLNYELFIDKTSGYFKKKNKLRPHQKYQLDSFEINQNIAESRYTFDNFFKNLKKKFLIFLNIFFFKKKFLFEKVIKIYGVKKAQYFSLPLKHKLSKTLYLSGHFENENYFINYKNNLQNLFKVKKEKLRLNNILVNQLKSLNSISIHVRINKYLEQPHEKVNYSKINKDFSFFNKTINYIYRAVNFFEKKLDNPKFFVWSNNFDNLEKYFDKNKFYFIENNNLINDFHLFSYVKHFIVGVSTYHWWGAWLNNNLNKICTCPIDLNPSDNDNFYPNSWIKI